MYYYRLSLTVTSMLVLLACDVGQPYRVICRDDGDCLPGTRCLTVPISFREGASTCSGLDDLTARNYVVYDQEMAQQMAAAGRITGCQVAVKVCDRDSIKAGVSDLAGAGYSVAYRGSLTGSAQIRDRDDTQSLDVVVVVETCEQFIFHIYPENAHRLCPDGTSCQSISENELPAAVQCK